MQSTAQNPTRLIKPSHGKTTDAFTRRAFVKRVLAATAAAQGIGLPLALGPATARAAELGPDNPQQRRNRAYRIRQEAALLEMQQPLPPHPDNGDEARYPNKIGSFSKGLPHNQWGEVDLTAYAALLRALSTGNPADFEAIPMGCPDPALRQKLCDPQAGLAFDLEGADSHALAIPPAPAFNSAEEAGEIVENYWMALTRDVAFTDYAANMDTLEAAADLSAQPDFRGPKTNGQVTPATLFRGPVPGCLDGPYISQFLWRYPPLGATYIEPRIQTLAPSINFMTKYDQWLGIQRGFPPTEQAQYDPVRRLIRNGRDLSQWVHMDVLYQTYFQAMLILLAPVSQDPFNGGIGAPLNPANPYYYSQTQTGFGTFGPPHVEVLLAEVAARALKAVWFQKWFVHRRLRPEAYAGRIQNALVPVSSPPRHYPLPPAVLGSAALPKVFSKYGTFLLPMAFPEGCPLHPAYGAGHATVAGACVTILKAWFDEDFVIPNPVEATADGLSLVPYQDTPLTVGGELNKLAANVALGRNIAGVHWRSDAKESLTLGEAVAISVLRDQRAIYNEPFSGWTFTRFDGSTVRV